ncbi:MAG: hypothetical protein KC553_10460 [Nitrospina sp.]|nr:hypothetical protein [Nitrospina sp.]
MPGHLTITGVCGWAIPPAWFEEQIALHFPGARIRAIYPESPADAQEAALLIRENPARLWIGFSLGSLWLMKHLDALPEGSTPAFLCPISGFTEEMGRGGKTRRVQLHYLIKQLNSQPESLATVSRFFQDMDLPLKALDHFPIKTAALIRGLEFLKTTEVEPDLNKNPCHLLIGERDPLMNARMLSDIFENLILIPQAGHHPGPLLARLSQVFVP